MKLDLSGKRCLLFTRAHVGAGHDEGSEQKQLAKLRSFARRRRLQVVGHVQGGGPTGAATRTSETITSLLKNRSQYKDFDVLLMTDLSRLSRDGICHAMHLISRLANASVGVVTLDVGLVGNGVFNAFHLRRFRKKKGRSSFDANKNTASRAADHQDDDKERGVQLPVRPEDMAERTREQRSRTP